jgi:hypothetical protein
VFVLALALLLTLGIKSMMTSVGTGIAGNGSSVAATLGAGVAVAGGSAVGTIGANVGLIACGLKNTVTGTGRLGGLGVGAVTAQATKEPVATHNAPKKENVRRTMATSLQCSPLRGCAQNLTIQLISKRWMRGLLNL